MALAGSLRGGLAALGDAPTAVGAAACYSIDPAVINAVREIMRLNTDTDSVLAVRNEVIKPGLEVIASGLYDELGEYADRLWTGIDSVHVGARPLFAAHRARPRPEQTDSGLSAWLAANCLRELRGDNHWALCAAADLDAVGVGLLHSAMVDTEEYGDQEWIARSRGNDDHSLKAGWARLADKGFAVGGTHRGRR